jgi:hypothetical protein
MEFNLAFKGLIIMSPLNTYNAVCIYKYGRFVLHMSAACFMVKTAFSYDKMESGPKHINPLMPELFF